MNTNHLARHYDRLTAPERLALVLAASARRDEVERLRLMETAPRIYLSAPHQFGLTQAFRGMARWQFMNLIDLAGAYFAAFAGIDQRPKAKAEAAWQDVKLMGYLFTTSLTGWRQFCAGLQFEPEVGWAHYPGYATIQAAERLTGPDPKTGLPGAAYVAEGAARWLARQALGDPEAELDEATVAAYWPVTAETIAANLREVWEHLCRRWEG